MCFVCVVCCVCVCFVCVCVWCGVLCCGVLCCGVLWSAVLCVVVVCCICEKHPNKGHKWIILQAKNKMKIVEEITKNGQTNWRNCQTTDSVFWHDMVYHGPKNVRKRSFFPTHFYTSSGIYRRFRPKVLSQTPKRTFLPEVLFQKS